jgi:hypothetical protein
MAHHISVYTGALSESMSDACCSEGLLMTCPTAHVHQRRATVDAFPSTRAYVEHLLQEGTLSTSCASRSTRDYSQRFLRAYKGSSIDLPAGRALQLANKGEEEGKYHMQ